MNLDQDLVLAYLEEDNIQRAYFRVRPLLTIHGNVQEEAVQLWPDEGCLRIVPDRAEQHTFKDRMRTLGSYCAVDLRGVPADAGKIRTNKNYRPERGEINQYILYSDAVKPLPDHTFFDVLEGSVEDAAALAAKSITPLFYIRCSDTLYGPVSKADPAKPEPAAEAAATLHTLETPDKATHLILCMASPASEAVKPAETPAAESVPEKAAPQEDAPLPLGKSLDILDKTKSHAETLHNLDQPVSKGANLLHAAEPAPSLAIPPAHQAPLSGTPLYRTQVKTSVPQPKNKLQEVVANQWRVARYEPPADSLPAGTSMRQVDNPVENACRSLRTAWQVTEAHVQLIDFILSLDGMQAKLEPRLTSAFADSPLRKTLVHHLEDLEAERLAALIELDKARSDVERFRKNSLASMSEKARSQYTSLEADKAKHEECISQLKEQINLLNAQRDELLARVDDLQQSVLPAALAKALADHQLNAPVNGIPLRMNCVTGGSCKAEELISRVTSAAGIPLSRNEAVALLALMAVSSRFGITSQSPAVVSTVMRNIVASLGWQNGYAQQVSAEQRPMATLASVDTTPAVLVTALANFAPLPSVTKIMLARTPAQQIASPAYMTDSWPILTLTAAGTVADAAVDASPVSFAAFKAALSEGRVVTDDQIDSILADLYKAVQPLSGKASAELHQFIAVCAHWMDGGLAAACDWAILLWLLPATDRTSAAVKTLAPLLQEYPLSLSALNQ